jgi:ferredoxin-type protein NapF
MSEVNTARRFFLKGRSAARAFQLPPYAVEAFHDLCDRCDDCIRKCPGQILVRGDGGFPQVDFSQGGCEFCRECAQACKHGALDVNRPTAWDKVATIGDTCLSMNGIVCRSCADPCQKRALSFQLHAGGRSMPRIDQHLCSGCGFCVSVCPQQVITIKEVA